MEDNNMELTKTLLDKATVLSRFQGCMVGAVVGDCLGAPFEMTWSIRPETVNTFFANLRKRGAEADEEGEKPEHPFTDDTAMARSVANSLIECRKMDATNMAQKFVKEYYQEIGRGYGASVGVVFKALRDANCAKPHGPAAEQFDGQGSYGNGGAMRIHPAALHAYNLDFHQLNEVVDECTRITHTHKDALNGAKLQCAAVHAALKHQGALPIDVTKFVTDLRQLMSKLEEPVEEKEGKSPERKRRVKRLSEEAEQPYCHKLNIIEQYLKGDTPNRETIDDVLGTDVSALGSVPAAVYSFLRSTCPVEDIKAENPFERTIMYAISLGGDTDTIASMAGAMAGAYYGVDSIPALWQVTCEGVTEAKLQADKLWHFVKEESEKQKHEENNQEKEEKPDEKD